MATRMRIVVGDITKLRVDAIVNAANQHMLGGGGVDGAIHRAAGPELLKACEQVTEVRPDVRCPTGEARITGGFNLSARHVIHTVGPVYNDGKHGEPRLLGRCYTHSLRLAEQHQLKTIAFPGISTGVYGYPKKDAAHIAVEAVRAWCHEHDLPQQVTICCHSQSDADIYRELLRM